MKVLSLFSGAGGLDLGFVRAGHELVWANDADPDCVATYRFNLGQHVVEEDIRRVRMASVPDADLVIGGFPCQGFSCANLRRSVRDERNILYMQFLRVLRAKQPPFFLAENVRGILSLSNGAVMDMILADFTKAGYRVVYDVFNMADYGVPQTRWRVIIVGVRQDLPPEVRVPFPAPTHAKHPSLLSNLLPWVTIKQALAGVPEPSAPDHGLANHVCSRYKVTNRNFTGHRRTDPDKPSPTILARGNGKGGVCAIQHPRNHRRLSVRESAIIQTFPNDFVFFGALNSMYRQVGNAVPPLFARRIAEQFARVEASTMVAV